MALPRVNGLPYFAGHTFRYVMRRQLMYSHEVRLRAASIVWKTRSEMTKIERQRAKKQASPM